MKKNTRDEKLVSAFLNDGFEFKGVKYKPLTARTLLLLERANSPFYFGGNELQGLLDLLYISSTDSKTILNSIENDTFLENVMEFADTLDSKDLEDLGNIVNKQNDEVSSTLVEVRSQGEKK